MIVFSGVGLNDMYILLSAWRYTNYVETSVKDRLGETLEGAAVSITLTSLSSATSFAIGKRYLEIYQFMKFRNLSIYEEINSVHVQHYVHCVMYTVDKQYSLCTMV